MSGSDLAPLEEAVLDYVCSSEKKVSPWDVERKLPGGAGRKQIRMAVKNLLARSELSYTQFYGRTFLEKSFNRPVKISGKVVLKPPSMGYQPGEGELVVNLQHGESFGTGSHPTTRLSIQGLEHARDFSGIDFSGGSSVDIGTGSGVLAIVAVLLGMDSCKAVDIDPCAVYEAKENVELNGLNSRIQVYDNMDLEAEKGHSLVIANLRCPTLVSLGPVIRKMLSAGGGAVFSGVKREEIPFLKEHYGRLGFSVIWESWEKQWAGISFFKS